MDDLETLKANIKYEKEIAKNLIIFNSKFQDAKKSGDKRKEKESERTISALLSLLKAVNASVPKILQEEKEEPAKETVSISYNIPDGRKNIVINKKDRENFIKDLNLSLESIKKLKKSEKLLAKEEIIFFKKPSVYAKISNKLFKNLSDNLAEKERFKRINLYMRKANMSFLLNTYISVCLMTGLISFFLGIAGFAVFLFFIKSTTDLVLAGLLVPGLPLIVLLFLYFYPYLESKSIEKKIDQELPFIAIHMSAIAGSGVVPSHIFKIIALSDEYPHAGQEFKKVVNQINVYGHDIITALRNSARMGSSKKMAELFNGLATTIGSGGKLTEFLDKRADTLLFDYKLERERYSRTAETFMDIYISIVIAAPMIMMLMLVLMSISGIGIGLSIFALTAVIILIVAVINIIFLVVLHLKQPNY